MEDLSYIQNLGGPPVQDLADAAGGTTVTGSLRLAERVVLELCTKEGSALYDTTRGTPFLALLEEQAYSETDVLVAFAASRAALKANLQGEELPTDDPSERYSDSAVSEVVVLPGVVRVTLSITSRAGLTTTVSLPVLVFTE